MVEFGWGVCTCGVACGDWCLSHSIHRELFVWNVVRVSFVL